jgi:hypothetical protein
MANATARVHVAPIPLAEQDKVVWPEIVQLTEQLDEATTPRFSSRGSGVALCENAGLLVMRQTAIVRA